MSQLFTPFTLRSTTFRNRVFVSPMCQYSAEDGMPTDWHLVHLGSRAVGGAGLVMVEATGVTADGRISPGDAGIWSDAHTPKWARIAGFIKEHGAVAGMQLAHAGRKASVEVPWKGGKPLAQGAWQTLAPSALPFNEGDPSPKEMTKQDIDTLAGLFVAAAKRALAAGFQVIELHAAHGYLLHEFLSPLTNKRTDEYGGSLENRMRLTLRVAKELRAVWPTELPLFVRISASDWVEGGWDLEQSIALAKELKTLGVDLIDCSSGGAVPHAKIPTTPGYQVPFSEGVRKHASIATGAVGLITEPEQAERIIASGQADVVLLARQMLRDPYWPLHAAQALKADIKWPVQYERAAK